MSGTGASLNDKIDLAPWGYAPGTSIATCADCSRLKPDPEDAVFIGHYFSHRCAEHALIARQSAIRIHEGILIPDPDREFEEAVYAIARDHLIRKAFITSLVLSPVLITAAIFYL